MAEACCGTEEPVDGSQGKEPEQLGEVAELRAAAVAGVLLVSGYVVGWSDGPALPGKVLLWGALLVGGSTFAPSTLRRLAGRRIGVGTPSTPTPPPWPRALVHA